MNSTLIKKFTVFTVFLLVIGCDNQLDNIHPLTDTPTDSFYSTAEEFTIALDGAYLQMRAYYALSMQGIGDIISDNLIIIETALLASASSPYYNFMYNPETFGAVEDVFSISYETINLANQIIFRIDNLKDDNSEKNNILGQALGIRAYAHFDLARLYAKIPTQDTEANASLGIKYLKAEDGEIGQSQNRAQYFRETVAENYTDIISDLTRAAEIIGEDNGEGRLNRSAIYALLSRVYLYNGDYQLASDAADNVTATTIATPTNLAGVYNDTNNDGVVWKLAFDTATELAPRVGRLYNAEVFGTLNPSYAIDFSFLLFNIPPTDIRRNIIRTPAGSGLTQYNAINKFVGEPGQTNGLVDIKVIRHAEVVLNKAEALYRLGFEEESLEALNMLRENRNGIPPIAETGLFLKMAIDRERRVELAFEGHRFFDLKRQGMDIQRSQFGELSTGGGTPAANRTLLAGDYRFQLPIPLSEINTNSNFVQNEEY